LTNIYGSSVFIQLFVSAIRPQSLDAKFQLSSNPQTSSLSLKSLNSSMKISEIRRHSESLGNFRADNKNLHIKKKKEIANHVSENKHSEQLFPLKVKENTKGNTSLSCDNIGTLEVLFEDSKSKTMKSVNGMDNKHQDSAGGAWRVLEEEISDVNLLIQTYSEKESVQGKVTLARLPHISMSNFIKFKS
jgi:hypothetical protein